MHQVAPTSYGPVRHEVQQQNPSFCLGSGCTQLVLGGFGPLFCSNCSRFGQNGGKAAGLPLQESHSYCFGLAKHALVLGPSGHLKPNPSVSVHSAEPSFKPDSTQKSAKSKSLCLVPRASAIKDQSFSEAVAAQNEAPQRGSTRSV